jgi:hypothetical protein
MKIEYIKTPVWANANHTMIDVTIKWEGVNDELPFTALPDDVEEHGRVIFEQASQGAFGVVADYTPPPNITGEEALTLLRQKRNNLLITEVDPIVSNPLRWDSLTQEEKDNYKQYRLALLNITTIYPNPVFVWDEDALGYVEQNVTWPTLT